MNEAASNNNGQAGILDPVWRLLDNGLAVLQNRIELFQVEVQEEKIRLAQMILLTSIITVLSTACLALGIITFVVMLEHSYLLEALTFLTIACAIGVVFAGFALRRILKSTVPLAATSEELRKDRQCIPRPPFKNSFNAKPS